MTCAPSEDSDQIMQLRTFIGLSPPVFYTDRSKAVLLLWFLTVTCSCCPYLYFGSAIMLVTYFVNFRLLNDHLFGKELFIRFSASAFCGLPSIWYLVISLLVLRAGCGIWLYQFLIIAYLFTLHLRILNLQIKFTFAHLHIQPNLTSLLRHNIIIHSVLTSMSYEYRVYLQLQSLCMTKPTTWLVRPAKTQIGLGIRPVWSVFAVRIKKAWVLGYPLSAQRRFWSDWADEQADLGLLWERTSFCWFCRAAFLIHLLSHSSVSF